MARDIRKDIMRDRKTDSIIPQSSDSIRPEHPRYRMTEEQKKKNAKHNESLATDIRNEKARAFAGKSGSPLVDTPLQETPIATPQAQSVTAPKVATASTTSPVQEEQKFEVPAPIISPEQKEQEQNRMKQEADAMTANKAMSQAPLDYGQMAQILDDNVKKSREKDALTEEQIRKRKRLFNAIGDGLGALTNLYFTTQSAPSVEYDPRGSLTARQQERWDAIDANRNALAQQEYQRKQNELAMRLAEQRQLRQEAIAARQRAEDKQWRQSEADRQYKQHQESLANQRAIQEMLMQNRLDQEKIAQSGANYRANVSADTQKQQAAASTAKAMRGKPLQFSDGKNTVSIYENVWKPSMQQVYDAMLADGVEDAMLKYGATAAQIENFVKQNWQKSPKAKELMKVLSNIDPAAEYNYIAEDEEESTPKTFEGFEPTKSNKVDY